MKITDNAANPLPAASAQPLCARPPRSVSSRRGGRWLRRLPWALGAGLALLSACSLPPVQADLTRFYVLSASTPPAGVEVAAPDAPRVLLRPVLVPEYLRGKTMQVRMAENEIRFVDEARWAETLEAGLNRVLRENLLHRSGVRVVGRGGELHDFEISVQLRRCEGLSPAGAARLAARIEIYSSDLEPKLVAADEFSTEVPGWDGKDFGQLAGKLSVAAATLSERIFTLLPTKTP